MKQFVIIAIIIMLLPLNSKAQTIVFNDKLLEQITKNHVVRLTSNTQMRKSLEKQNDLYNSANTKIAQIVLIHELIYSQLVNVNMALKQGKRVYYIYQNLEKIATNSAEMIELTVEYPQYAILITKYYDFVITESLKLIAEVQDEILKEDKHYLMDPYDREMLLRKIYDRTTMINGTIMLINLSLKKAKNRPYLYQIPGIMNWIAIDKMIIKDIVFKYGILKN